MEIIWFFVENLLFLSSASALKMIPIFLQFGIVNFIEKIHVFHSLKAHLNFPFIKKYYFYLIS